LKRERRARKLVKALPEQLMIELRRDERGGRAVMLHL
jgi:hypothetical protein